MKPYQNSQIGSQPRSKASSTNELNKQVNIKEVIQKARDSVYGGLTSRDLALSSTKKDTGGSFKHERLPIKGKLAKIM